MWFRCVVNFVEHEYFSQTLVRIQLGGVGVQALASKWSRAVLKSMGGLGLGSWIEGPTSGSDFEPAGICVQDLCPSNFFSEHDSICCVS